MNIERPSRHIPVDVSFHAKWWHDKFGVLQDEAHLSNIEYVIDRNREMARQLHKLYGHLGLGQQDPQIIPVVKGFGITTIAQLFGCKVIFQDDEEPYAIPLNLNDEEIMKLEPIRDFTKLYPMNFHLEQAEYLMKKYGKAKISINYQGYLSTALKLRGDQIFVDFYENPELAKRVLDISFETTENLREFINKVNAKNGYPDIERVQSTNCAVTMISPQMYEKFIMPYDRIIAERYGPNYGIHHCGKNMDNYAELYGSLGKGVYYDIGYGSDVKKCVDNFKVEGMKQLIRGRVSAGLLLLEDADRIDKEIKRIVDSGVNFIVCVGADQNTPDENLEAYFQSVWKHS